MFTDHAKQRLVERYKITEESLDLLMTRIADKLKKMDFIICGYNGKWVVEISILHIIKHKRKRDIGSLKEYYLVVDFKNDNDITVITALKKNQVNRPKPKPTKEKKTIQPSFELNKSFTGLLLKKIQKQKEKV